MISVRTLLAELTSLDVAAPPVPVRRADPTLDAAIRRHVEAILRQTYGNQAKAASLLGISRTNLATRLRRWQQADARTGVRCLHCAGPAVWVAHPREEGYYRCPRCRVGFMA